ncbi:hypothetical protein CP10139811_0658 [Chlamydia ibidis]|uniref:Uncharacterized protein n=2 Tax=Chlamydia ibidis TaxID=1405396 RepID=S7J393_9CHLA|nr:hypothetical protein [Chlamydia ibidis]EPP34874.1 hypothetical protein CP10139811_0658 [Chlamydia ibidis]EQM62270.1 hypothetical protein H359_1043 [Chlamydia ibidis 10-1398/6]
MTTNTFGTLDILMKHSKEDNLGSFLPEDLLVTSPHPEDIPLKSLSFTMCWLATIHPSWISLAMKSFPEQAQSQILAWLPSSLIQELSPLLPKIAIASKRCSNFGAFYLLDMLSSKIRPPGIIEEIFLPASPLNGLLYYSATTKMTLINCLGLHTLAKELKNVVDKVVIERVHKLLTPTEKLFLAYCQSHPIKHLEPTTFLLSWEADDELRNFLHREGLKLLAMALAKEDASFLWYFLRRLDVGRAYIFEEALRKSYDHPHGDYFKDRLEQCIKVLVP